MKLKKLTFVFENCDYFSVLAEHTSHLQLSDIKKEVHCFSDNSIVNSYIAENFAIMLHREANVSYSHFGLSDTNDVGNKFERILQYADITQIELECEETVDEHTVKSMTYRYYMNWDDSEDMNNNYQKTVLNNDGDLFIVISASKQISDYFDLGDTK